MSTESEGLGDGPRPGSDRGEALRGNTPEARSLAIAVIGPGPEKGPPALQVFDGEGEPDIIPREQFGTFLSRHAQDRLLCEEVGHLVGVLDRALRGGKNEVDAQGLRCLWEAARSGRFHDVGLADQVLKFFVIRRTEKLRHALKWSSQFVGFSSEQKEEICRDWYLVASTAKERITAASTGQRGPTDSRSVFERWLDQDQKWKDYRRRDRFYLLSPPKATASDDWPDELARAVRRAVAVQAARETGLRVDREEAGRIGEQCEAVLNRESRILWKDSLIEPCFRWDEHQRIRRTGGGHPKTDEKKLRAWLGTFRGTGNLAELRFDLPAAADGEPSSLPEDWSDVAWGWPTIEAWMAVHAASSVLHQVDGQDHAGPIRIRPTYEVHPRLACRAPDLGLLPRLIGRPLFEADPGHHFVIIEPHRLELRCYVDQVERQPDVGRTPIGDLIRAEDWIRDSMEALPFRHDSDSGPNDLNRRMSQCRWMRHQLSPGGGATEPDSVPDSPAGAAWFACDRPSLEARTQRFRDAFNSLDDSFQSSILEMLDHAGSIELLLANRIRTAFESDGSIRASIFAREFEDPGRDARLAGFFLDCVVRSRSHREVRTLAEREFEIVLPEREAGRAFAHVVALLGSLGWFEASATRLRDWAQDSFVTCRDTPFSCPQLLLEEPFEQFGLAAPRIQSAVDRERFWPFPLDSWRGDQDAFLVQAFFDQCSTSSLHRSGLLAAPLIVWAYCFHTAPKRETYMLDTKIMDSIIDRSYAVVNLCPWE